ncbi:MAG: hypothetical protein K2Y40_10105 [Reyranella sp.]|nr:hypothetical protein [Reyranella sp.]
MTEPVDPTWEIGRLLLTAVASGLITYFVGRYSKSREYMTADLADNVREYRALVHAIRDQSVEYWSRSPAPGDKSVEAELTRRLHRMVRLRVHCTDVSKGFRSERLRALEYSFADVVSGGLFGSSGRLADDALTSRIYNLSEDIDFAALAARRADLFPFPRRRYP